MGYAPDWNKGSMKKSGATPVKHGVVSRELFHNSNSVQRLADGGGVMGDMSGADMKYEPMPKTDELNIRGEKVGRYEGTDPIVKYRMNMTDDVGGKSLRYQDNPDAKPMPEKRPYDSIDAIIDDKSSSGKKDKGLVGDVVKAVKEANKPKPVATPKAKSSRSGDSFSDDARSPDQVAAPIPKFSDDSRSPDQVTKPYRLAKMPEEFQAEEGTDLSASKRVAPVNNKATYKGTNRSKRSKDELSIDLSGQSPALAKRLNMYYGKK